MSVDDIRNLYAYNRWANRRLLSAVALLEPQELVRRLGGSFGTVQATLVHIMWGEWVWLRRWRGESPKRRFDPSEFPRIVDIELHWDAIAGDQADYIAGLTEERVTARLSYENLQGERWEYSLGHMLQHVVNHSSYHRGQVAMLLRQLGREPPATDFLIYLDELDGREGGGTSRSPALSDG